MGRATILSHPIPTLGTWMSQNLPIGTLGYWRECGTSCLDTWDDIPFWYPAEHPIESWILGSRYWSIRTKPDLLPPLGKTNTLSKLPLSLRKLFTISTICSKRKFLLERWLIKQANQSHWGCKSYEDHSKRPKEILIYGANIIHVYNTRVIQKLHKKPYGSLNKQSRPSN